MLWFWGPGREESRSSKALRGTEGAVMMVRRPADIAKAELTDI